MPTREPPGRPAAPPTPPAAPDADFELADGAIDLLDLAPQNAGPHAPQSDQPTAQIQQPIIASELVQPDHSEGPAAKARPRRKARAFALGGAAALVGLCAGLMQMRLWPFSADTAQQAAQGRQAHIDITALLPKPAATMPTAPPLTAVIPSQAAQPLTLPAPVLTALTLAAVDNLDGQSLMALGQQVPSTDDEAADLWAWAQVRRLAAMGDGQARPLLEGWLQRSAPLPELTTLGHGRRRERAKARHHRARALREETVSAEKLRPLQAAAMGGAALLIEPRARAQRALEVLGPLLEGTPQGQLVLAMGQAMGIEGLRPRPRRDRLQALVARAPNLTDAKIALARSCIAEGDNHAAMALLGPLAMADAPDTWARAAHLIWQAGQMAALSDVMARRLAGVTGAQLAQALAQTSLSHQTVLRRLMMRHLAEQGDMTGALEWALAQCQASPQGALSAWDALRLAHLNHVAPPGNALATITQDKSTAGIAALTLASGAWRLNVPQWRAAASPLLKILGDRAAVTKLTDALDKEAQGQRAEAIDALRQVSLSAKEAPAVATLARALVASLRTNKADDRLEALRTLSFSPPRLDNESLRPDIMEASVRAFDAAQVARRPVQVQQAAQYQLWQDPWAQDPFVSMTAWAESASGRHHALDRDPNMDPGINKLLQLIAQRPQDDALAQRTIVLAEEAAPARLPGLLQTLLLRHPKDLPLTVALVDAYVAQGQKDAAQEALKPWPLTVGPGAQEPLLLYAHARLVAANDPAQARALLDLAMRSEHPEGRFMGLLAELSLAHNQSDEALQELKRAGELAPNDVQLHLRYAHLLMAHKELASAQEVTSQMLTWPMTQSQQAAVWLQQADIAREQNDTSKAAQALSQALALRPADTGLMLRLGRLELQELSDAKGALGHLQQVVAQEPNQASAQYFLAVALREVGDSREAKKAFARYLQLAPSGDYAVDAQDALQSPER